MSKFYFIPVTLLLCSCGVQVKYLGNSYEPVKNTDLYVDAKSIDRPYKIVAKGYPSYTYKMSVEKLQKKAIEKAKKKGADAVLIQDYFIPNTGVTINSAYRSDSVGKSLITVGNSSIDNTGNTGFVILFLKYTDR